MSLYTYNVSRMAKGYAEMESIFCRRANPFGRNCDARYNARQSGLEIVGALCALLAGIIPSIYKALGFDISLDEIAKNGHEFKILQDRFRQAARVTSLGAPETFASEFSDLMARWIRHGNQV